jgi:hypothetical protein
MPATGISFGHPRQVALILMDSWLGLTEYDRTWHRIPSLDTQPLVFICTPSVHKLVDVRDFQGKLVKGKKKMHWSTRILRNTCTQPRL